MQVIWASLIVVFTALGTSAHQPGIQWHQDLEAAKKIAKDSGRLVLIHFWTTSCGPCVALEQNVFSQPGVAPAIESKFVPVKLDADQNKATAEWFGITHVPADVIITPDGQLVGKLISPPTPMAYVAETNALATKYASKSANAFAAAAASAPVQPRINAAYAGLGVSQSVPPALSPAATPAANPSGASGFGSGGMFGPSGYGEPTGSTAANSTASVPQTISNPAFTGSGSPSGPAPITPVGNPPFSAQPLQTTNPYIQAPSVPPATAAAASPTSIPSGFVNPPNLPNSPGPQLASAPDPAKLPPGSPPLGFDGYCPVSMRNSWKWIPGDPRWGIIHDGRTYWFAGPAEQQQFWKDPTRYAPALAGMDPVLAVDHQQRVPGKREHSLDYDGLFYLFASEATLQQFSANPQRYAASVRQAMGIPRGRLVR